MLQKSFPAILLIAALIKALLDKDREHSWLSLQPPVLSCGLLARIDSNRQNSYWVTKHFWSLDMVEPPHKPLRSIGSPSCFIALETKAERGK